MFSLRHLRSQTEHFAHPKAALDWFSSDRIGSSDTVSAKTNREGYIFFQSEQIRCMTQHTYVQRVLITNYYD